MLFHLKRSINCYGFAQVPVAGPSGSKGRAVGHAVEEWKIGFVTATVLLLNMAGVTAEAIQANLRIAAMVPCVNDK